MGYSQQVSLRFTESDMEQLQTEADARRMTLASYLRMLVFAGRDETRTLDVLIHAVQANPEKRLRLRRLLTNPLEG